MEEKKSSDNQKLISKIKYIRSLSPSNNDSQNRKRESKETPEESENKYESSLTKNKSKKKTTYKTKKNNVNTKIIIKRLIVIGIWKIPLIKRISYMKIKEIKF